jgi:16S rRNA (guanine966-N2)-methyltransferase
VLHTVARAERGVLRIVGGRWRGRRLPVLSQPGLRPTTDRVRETLFNWVSPWIEGAGCLDCFAGSGALGLEAASRGAREVVMLERSAAAVRALRANVTVLAAEQARVCHTDALDWLATMPVTPFDLCFVDPPFSSDLLAPTLSQLAARGWVRTDGMVYVESARGEPLPPLPESWEWFRDKVSGQVRYGLLRVVSG